MATNAVLTGRTVNVKPSPKPLKSVQVNARRPAPEQRRQDQQNQRQEAALRTENAQLKKGIDNTQIMTELKYTRSQVESLKKSLAQRDTEIASLKAKIAKQDTEIGTLVAELDAKDAAANGPVGPGATSPSTTD